MADFTKTNPALEAKIAAAQSSAEIADILRDWQMASGQPSLYDGRVMEPPQVPSNVRVSPSVDVPKDDGRLLRKGVVLPDGRIQLIEAYSYAGLDFLEQALLKQR